MTTNASKGRRKTAAATTPPAGIPSEAAGAEVDALLAGLHHPLEADIRAVRQLILGAGPGVAEGIKWNAPSFRTTEYFATVNLRARDQVQVILHLGAKVRTPAVALKIEDPAGLLTWLAKDRGSVALAPGAASGPHGRALQDIVRQWTGFV